MTTVIKCSNRTTEDHDDGSEREVQAEEDLPISVHEALEHEHALHGPEPAGPALDEVVEPSRGPQTVQQPLRAEVEALDDEEDAPADEVLEQHSVEREVEESAHEL